jgi:hypothetical protein
MKMAAALVTLLAAGCGSGGDKPSTEPRTTGTVDLERPAAGPPDAGTSAGHGNEGAVATTSADVFSFVGQVDPGSAVKVAGGVVRTESSGRFTVATTSPEQGVAKELRIEAAKPGRRPWTFEVRLERGAPARVRVPARDDEAPSAALALSPVGKPAVAVQPSPSKAGEDPVEVQLDEPRFRATAAVRDAEGGTGRIRISVESVTRCGDTARTTVRVIPPAQIVNIAIPPGARAPVERQRSALIELDAPERCTVSGEVLAEGTDAHGRQAVTAHIGFAYR